MKSDVLAKFILLHGSIEDYLKKSVLNDEMNNFTIYGSYSKFRFDRNAELNVEKYPITIEELQELSNNITEFLLKNLNLEEEYNFLLDDMEKHIYKHVFYEVLDTDRSRSGY